MLDPGIGYVIVIAFAALLGQAAIHKLRSVPQFAAVLEAYRLLPAASVPLLAPVVPLAEGVIAALLLWPATRVVGSGAAVVLLLGYAGAILINLRRGRHDLDCGCGGPGDRQPIAAWMVWRNALLACLVALGGLPWSPRPLAATDLLTIGGGLAVLALLYLTLDRLLGQVLPRTLALRGGR